MFKVGDKVEVVNLDGTDLTENEAPIGFVGTITFVGDYDFEVECKDFVSHDKKWFFNERNIKLVNGKDRLVNKFINSKNFDVIEYDGIPKGEDLVKIPEDADYCLGGFDCSQGIAFYKHDFKLVMDPFYKKDVWFTCGHTIGELIENGGEIVWQRDGVHKDKESIDFINHPKHYTEDPSGVECIELTSCLSAPISNSLKYVWRCGLKDDDVQELGKAMFYLDYAIEHNIDVGCNGMNETFEFEQKVKQVLSHWSGWKYIFLNALYWNDKEQMKRALSELLNEAKSKSC